MIKKILYSTLVVILISGFVAGYVGYRYTRGRFVNNVFIAGVDVSYKTVNEARDLVNVRVNSFYNGKLPVFVDNEFVEFSPADIGLIVYTDETFEKVTNTDFDRFSFKNIVRS